MANQVNIIEQCNTTVQVTDQVKEVVQVVTLGPQGPMGPKGDVPDGFNEFTASFNHFTASYNTGSFTGSFYGQVYGSASYATTASWAAYAANVPDTASFSVSSSYARTASWAAYAANVPATASFAVSASFANSSEYPIKATGSFSLYGPGAGDLASTANVILLGNSAGNTAAHANGAVMLGASAGGSMRSGSNSVVIGTQAGEFSTYARSAVFLGNQAGRGATYASYSVMIGELAGSNSEPLAYSVVLGYYAGSSIFGAQASTRYSNFIGYAAGLSAMSSSYSNFLGYYAGYGAQSSMFSNFIGYKAGYSDGSTWPGSNTTIIGTNISLAPNLNNYVNLGAVLFISGTYSNPNVDAPFTGSNNGRVGINTTLPAYSLDVSGSGRFTGPLLANNLTGSLYGTASWALNVVGLSATSSYALTASYAPAYLPLTGGTITGDIQVLGTASIAFLNVTYESSSVIYSSGSNQLGDSELDFQRLYGTVTVVTGSMNAPIFSGSGANLFNIPASAVTGLSTSQINTGSVVAKVDTGTGSFALSSGSSTFLFVSSSGNVGIGTNAPSGILDVYSAPLSASVLKIGTSQNFSITANTQSTNRFQLFNISRIGSPSIEAVSIGVGTGPTAGSGVISANNDNLIFGYAFSGTFNETYRITTQKNLLLGTTTDAGYRLDVNGTSRFSNNMIVSGSGGSAYALTTTNGWVQFGSTTGFTWDNSNNRVGIGTNAPDSDLHISKADAVLKITNTSNSNSVTFGFPALAGGQPALSMFTTGVTNGRIFQRQTTTNTVYIGDIDNNNGGVIVRAAGVDTINIFPTTKNTVLQNGGTFVDSGYRLDVNGSGSASGGLRVVSGSTLLVGAGSTSATNALVVQNSSATNLFTVRNDGLATFGGSITQTNIGDTLTIGSAINFVSSQPTITGLTSLSLVTGNAGQTNIGKSAAITSTSGLFQVAVVGTDAGNFRSFSPTSGTATYTVLRIAAEINQTGGANGITRGLYVNPTLTAAADWRSIEWSNNIGWGLYGAGTANNYLGGSLGIGTTSLTGFSLSVAKNLSGSVFATGIAQGGIVQSDVTSTAFGIINTANSVNSAFTFAYTHFAAAQGTIGASSTISTQIGFLAASSMNTGSSIYGFRGQIVSGSGRWNMYMDGTADNHLSGKLLIGTNTDSGYKLDVSGSTRVQGTLYLGTGATKYLDVAASDALWNTSLRVNANFWANTQMMVGNYSSINSSAALQIESTTKGFLPPRMTGAQAESIASPAEGLMVYATDAGSGAITSKGWWGYDGTTWVKLN